MQNRALHIWAGHPWLSFILSPHPKLAPCILSSELLCPTWAWQHNTGWNRWCPWTLMLYKHIVFFVFKLIEKGLQLCRKSGKRYGCASHSSPGAAAVLVPALCWVSDPQCPGCTPAQTAGRRLCGSWRPGATPPPAAPPPGLAAAASGCVLLPPLATPRQAKHTNTWMHSHANRRKGVTTQTQIWV